MSDEVRGISVIGKFPQDNDYMLWCLTGPDSDPKFRKVSNIVLYPSWNEKVISQNKSTWGVTAWEPRHLRIRPSLLRTDTGFHTAYDWRTEYVEVAPTEHGFDGEQLLLEINDPVDGPRLLKQYLEIGVFLPRK